MKQILKIMRLLNRFKVLIVPFVFVSFLSSVSAQEKSDLSRCIKIGLEQNFALQIERNNEEIDANNFTRGNAGMLPEITNSNQFNGNLNSTVQNYSDGGQNTRNGVHSTSGRSSIDIGMTIFRGFQVKNTYKKLEHQKEIGGLNTQMSIENLVAQIVSEYHNYIQQLVLYENLKYAVSLSRERVRIDEERYLLGGASKMQLLQSKVYLNADSSRYARQKEVLHTSRIKLNKLMASENLEELIVIDDTTININKELKFDDLLEQMLEYNTSLQIASQNQIVTELDYEIIKSRSYPYLNVNAGYAYNYNDYGYGETANQHQHGMNYGVSVGIDIFDGFNRQREQTNAQIRIDNGEIRYKEIEQQVKADLHTLFFAYENNLRLLELEQQNLEVARENLEIAMQQYKLGSLAGIELREVQKSLLDAEERLISVKYLAKVAEVSIKQISGSIMDYL